MSEAAFAQRASGIFVASATLDKKTYTLPEADFRKMKRLMTFAREFGLIAMYFCETCKAPAQLKQADRIIATDRDGKNMPGGRLTISCECSTWTIR